MTWLPILTPWLYLPLAALVLGAAVFLLLLSRSAARWRYAVLVLLVVLAGARPGFISASAPAANSELNIFFVVDTTPSSAAEDYAGGSPRMEGIRTDINQLAAEFAGARFSLITFDTSATVALPLTTDTTALRTLTEILAPRPVYNSSGSSITIADQVLAARLADAAESHPERPRLVFYFGDGEQTAATAPPPFTASTPLIDGGAVLGYGSDAGGQMRDYSLNGKAGPWIVDTNGAPARSRMDEAALTALASQLHVPYVHRESPDQLAAALTKSSPSVAQQGTDSASPANSPGASRDGAGRWELYWLLALAAFGTALWELGSLAYSWRSLQRTGKASS